VLGKPENGRALRLGVAADALEDAGAIVDDMAHDVDGGVLPGDQISVMPDVGGLGDRHGDSASSLSRQMSECLKRSAIEGGLSRKAGRAVEAGSRLATLMREAMDQGGSLDFASLRVRESQDDDWY